MTVPLMALAALSLGGGFINVPKWLEPMFPSPRDTRTIPSWRSPLRPGLIGIGLAYFLYVLRPGAGRFDRIAAWEGCTSWFTTNTSWMKSTTLP